MFISQRRIYELHIEGMSAKNTNLPASVRGKFMGLCHPWTIQHLHNLDINTVQIMPLFDCKETYWGYDVVDWFKHNPSYGTLEELRTMVQTLQTNGIKVILDVVYNHTAVPMKGVSYYDWNVTGCENTVNVQKSLPVIMRSIDYWLTDIGVDGMRFDLANVMGREGGDFNADAAFFKCMEKYTDKILIAEPWDLGQVCYDYPKPWLVLNGKGRDMLRRGHPVTDYSHRPADLLINFVTCHDGNTLHDLVTYEGKYNLANGEGNRDGCNHTLAYNHGVEGETDNVIVNAQRDLRKYWYNIQLMSSYHWMMYMGDEVHHTQKGNNNAYRYGNDINHINWERLSA